MTKQFLTAVFATKLDQEWKREKARRAVDEARSDQIVVIKDSTRSLEQNSKFHSLCRDAALHLQYSSKRLSADQWKVLFISGHAIATGRPVEIVPGLEGELVNIRESSAKMSLIRMSSLIEYVEAYLADKK